MSAPALVLNATLRIGEWIETDAQSRVGLRFSSGTSVRLDSGSRVRALSPTAIELTAGAVYVDTGDESGRLEVQTPFATAHDLGTQFEVRLIARTVRLRVRTGVVELRDATRSVSGRAGTEIALSETGAVSRPVATHGAEWDWTAGLGSLPEMEGMSLASFLERLAHEQGLAVHYADPTLAREATGIVLHGSVRDLAPEQAIETAIATSGLRHRLEDRTLFVLRAPNGK